MYNRLIFQDGFVPLHKREKLVPSFWRICSGVVGLDSAASGRVSQIDHAMRQLA